MSATLVDFTSWHRARIYTDSPEKADVMDIDSPRPRQFGADVQVIAEYMNRVAGVKTILVVGPRGGCEPRITLA